MADNNRDGVLSFRNATTRRHLLKLFGIAGGAAAVSTPVSSYKMETSQTGTFNPIEATISDIVSAIVTEQATATEIVQAYLERIDTYDEALNAIITVNPGAIERARNLDNKFEETGLAGPLHGVPIVLKDNYDTSDLPTTAGSLALEDSVPPDDAYMVKQLRTAGAIVVGKTNLDEFAFSAESKSSLGGATRNPYDLDRLPGGSSGGTGASVASNLAVFGTGSDTGGSIRIPAAYANLVGLRPTIGVLSRDGIVPISLTKDTGGFLTRTVTDTAIAFAHV